MIQDIGVNRFHNEYCKEKPDPDSIVLCYRGREIFVKCEEDQLIFLTYEEVT